MLPPFADDWLQHKDERTIAKRKREVIVVLITLPSDAD